ncbi:MAG: serpin family protein [candidate division Zixibacteria bacterium]|nr:serpin family protein [candidate division Zixibacteria bacterium]
MFRKAIILLILSCWMLLVQCSDKSTPPPTPTPVRDLTTAEKELVTSGNKFGLKLFREIVSQEGDKNVFVSPLSVAMALGMTYNGANGATQEAMQNTLELQGMSLEDVNKSYRSVIDLLRGLDSKVTFQIANSIWYRQGFEVEPTFVDLNMTYFDAVVRALDFADPSAVVTINGWVNENTHGKIDKILDEIPDATVMYLIDAIYFKGIWKLQFDPKKTTAEPFHLPDGSVKSCQMMAMPETDIAYFGTREFSAIDLKYGDGDYSMTILLPNQNMNLDSVMAQLTDENWQSWLGQFRLQNWALQIPKFEIEYEKSLKEVLSALGMGVAFSDFADFTGINRRRNLQITAVKHKTYVKVDEEGTEAAAVTSVEIGLTSTGPRIFIVNRPFLLVIHENHSGTILFMGKIVDPTL